MSKKIVLGELVDAALAPVGGSMRVDVDVLLRTRLLVQAASGQGKSHFLRLLIERLFPYAQIFIVDHEGDFSTLRPAYDFVLIGEGGDALPDVRTAGLLSRRLLELGNSAVFDLSEAFRKHPGQRRAWVRAFLSELMEAPRRLWHPVFIIVDEAHKYCPEKDEAESSDAMTAIATDGRKRQFCAIWATQRLAKLNKDAAAELLNKMIGGTSLDLDRKRAADDLGVYGKSLQSFNDEIKVIERGYFYGIGPAIAKSRTLVHVDKTATSPPKVGRRASAPPPPSAKIKKLLPQLADLPKEVAQKEQTEAELRATIRRLETEARKVKTPPPPPPVIQQMQTLRHFVGFEELNEALAPIVKRFKETAQNQVDDLRARLEKFVQVEFTPLFVPVPTQKDLREAAAKLNSKTPEPKTSGKAKEPIRGARMGETAPAIPVRIAPVGERTSSGGLKLGARELLKALARRGAPIATDELGIIIGAARRTLTDYLSILKSRGLIVQDADGFSITELGTAVAGPVAPEARSTEELLELWRPKFKEGANRILAALVLAYPAAVERSDLMARSNVAATRTMSDYLGMLRQARLITESRQGFTAAKSLFP